MKKSFEVSPTSPELDERSLKNKIKETIKKIGEIVFPSNKTVLFLLLTRCLPLATTLTGQIINQELNAKRASIAQKQRAEDQKQHTELLEREREQKNAIEKLTGGGTVGMTEYTAKVNSEFERYSELGRTTPPITFENFQHYPEFSRALDATLADTVPKGFAKNVREIAYEDRLVPMATVYGLDGDVEAARAEINDRRIVFSKGIQLCSAEGVFNDVFLHETAHLNDYLDNDLLTAIERLELLNSIVTRLRSPDRYRSGYVEAISNDDNQTELRTKAKEYLAEIAGAYLRNDQLLPEEDALVIKNLIAKTDPGFDRDQALSTRKVIIEAYEENSQNEKPFQEPIRFDLDESAGKG
jgi:hypothetical protein